MANFISRRVILAPALPEPAKLRSNRSKFRISRGWVRAAVMHRVADLDARRETIEDETPHLAPQEAACRPADLAAMVQF
jgi:hypothetical protein